MLRSEGLAAAHDRILDRLADFRRARRYAPLRADEVAAFPSPILNLLATPPSPRFGGVPTQFLARFAHEEKERPTALLYPTGHGYRLELTHSGRRGRLDLPGSALAPTVLEDEAFEAAVTAAIDALGARLVHAEGLAGLPLGSLHRLSRRGLSLVVSVHDFALFCPRPHLLERPAECFCDYCRDLERCARCLGVDWRVGDGFQARRRALATELLASAEAVAYPSTFLRDRHQDLFGPLDPARQHVIAPMIDLPEPAPPRAPRPIRHIAYVGAVHPHKGALVFEEVVRSLSTSPDLRFTVFGGGDPDILARLRRLPRVRIRGYYRSGALASLLRGHDVDLALLLSIWPESYGITLDECRAAGVPVLAFDHGAIGERVRVEGWGTTVPLGEGAPGFTRAVLRTGENTPPSAGVDMARPRPADAGEAALALYSVLLRGSAPLPPNPSPSR